LGRRIVNEERWHSSSQQACLTGPITLFRTPQCRPIGTGHPRLRNATGPAPRTATASLECLAGGAFVESIGRAHLGLPVRSCGCASVQSDAGSRLPDPQAAWHTSVSEVMVDLKGPSDGSLYRLELHCSAGDDPARRARSSGRCDQAESPGLARGVRDARARALCRHRAAAPRHI
jgi:hypothetical protein